MTRNIYDMKYNLYKNQPKFKGEIFPSGYYFDSEIATAKKVMDQKNWVDEYRKKRFKELMKKYYDRIEECLDYDSDHKIKTALCVLPPSATLLVGIVSEYREVRKVNEKIG